MNYEQKYKEALERATKIHSKERITGIELVTCEEIFPELKDSENKKIRDEIILYIGAKDDISLDTHNKWLSWLEKQSEKTELIDGFNTEFERQISHLIASIINKEYDYTKDFVKWASDSLLHYAKHEFEKQGEQKPAEWSVEDIANGWAGEDLKRYISCLQRLGTGNPQQPETINSKWFKEHCKPQPKQEWSEEDEERLMCTTISFLKDFADKGYENAFECIDWLKSFKDRVQPQSKQEWSEEDEKMLSSTIFYLDEFREVYQKGAQECIAWFKSLKPNHWKPSEEQIDALRVYLYHPQYIDNSGNITIRLVESLYNDLKKL